MMYVALFRGLNVGTGNRVSMKVLKPLFAECGCLNVQSYVQSGNLVFGFDGSIAELQETLEQRLRDELNLKTWLVMRDLPAMRQVVANNPFDHLQPEGTQLAAAFLRDGFHLKTAITFEDSDIPDKVSGKDGEVYLYIPNGFSGSKLPPKAFAEELKNSTTRNWCMVTRLLAMMEELAAAESST